jgi:hypothetical protein
MAAMIVKGPPHWEQCSMSIANTRLSSRAQRMRAGAEGWGALRGSLAVLLALTGALGTIWGRSLALGASTPWDEFKQAFQKELGTLPEDTRAALEKMETTGGFGPRVMQMLLRFVEMRHEQAKAQEPKQPELKVVL